MPGIQCLKGHGMNALCVVGTICLEYNATCLNCCCDWTTTPGMCRTKRCARNVTIGPAMLRSLRKQARRQASMIPRQETKQARKPSQETRRRQAYAENATAGTGILEHNTWNTIAVDHEASRKKKAKPFTQRELGHDTQTTIGSCS